MQLAPVCLDDIIGNAQPQSRSFRPFLGGEEGLQNLVSDRVGNTRAIVDNGDFYPITVALCASREFRFVVGIFLALSRMASKALLAKLRTTLLKSSPIRFTCPRFSSRSKVELHVYRVFTRPHSVKGQVDVFLHQGIEVGGLHLDHCHHGCAGAWISRCHLRGCRVGVFWWRLALTSVMISLWHPLSR